MKYLITGANGMLASALCPILTERGNEVISTDINAPEMNALDVRDSEGVMSFFRKNRPEVVMHLAAATDMDMCQKNPEDTYAINARGVRNVACACKEVSAEMVYVSTGAVFDGKKDGPYIESDRTNPLNIYGETKLAGEHFLQDILKKHYIFRAGWIIGGFEKDIKFVGKTLELLRTRKELNMVSDRFGSPTCVEDFSRNMLKIVEAGLYGLYHLVNKGGCSRYDMAKKIVNFLGRDDIKITPIRNIDYPSVTPRARTEIMTNHKLQEAGMDDMVSWEKALHNYLEKLKSKKLLDRVMLGDGVA
ncbi:MAG: dTDP-4-dehydrorhamnose reductase [Candidatus Omnitrophota bacterium]|nr:MAG: dTDP-4-dehydrorhamnose reductase [Candidatus Omnitrophota bacterium]